MKRPTNGSKLFASSESVESILEDLQPGLRIDEHALDDACQRQPELFQRVSDELTFAISRRDEAKIIVAEVEAAVDLEIRNKGREREKLTDRGIAAMVRIDRRVQTASREHLRLAHEAARLASLKESFQQRSYMLKEMTKLYLASYFGDITQTADTSQIKTARAVGIKDQLNRMRRGQE